MREGLPRMVYKNVTLCSAKFHTSAISLARNRLPTNIKLRRPILPTINNLQTNEDHPLYQFFPGKKFLRSTTEITTDGRHWSIPELRRKSFDDLHCLWYIILKERNVLAKEYLIMNATNAATAAMYEEQSNKLRESMWRIKYVLHERINQAEKAKVHFNANREQYLQEYAEEYLASDNVETEEWYDKLERLQFAFFGIPAQISLDMEIDVDYILGIRFVGDLIFKKFKSESTEIQELRDITEHYALFEEEPTSEGFSNGINKILEYRQSNVLIPKNKDIMVVQALIKSRIEQIDASG